MVIAKMDNIVPTHSYPWLQMYVLVGARMFVWFQPNVVAHVQFAHGDLDVKDKREVKRS